MTTTGVNVDSNGNITQFNAPSNSPTISSNGRYIAYASYAQNIVPGASSSPANIYLYDTVTKKNSLVSANSNTIIGSQGGFASSSLPAISGDGSAIAYLTGPNYELSEIYLYNTLTNKTTYVGKGLSANQTNISSDSLSVNGNGRYVAYASDASNLVIGDTNDSSDIFIYDTVTNKNTSGGDKGS